MRAAKAAGLEVTPCSYCMDSRRVLEEEDKVQGQVVVVVEEGWEMVQGRRSRRAVEVQRKEGDPLKGWCTIMVDRRTGGQESVGGEHHRPARPWEALGGPRREGGASRCGEGGYYGGGEVGPGGAEEGGEVLVEEQGSSRLYERSPTKEGEAVATRRLEELRRREVAG